MPPALESGIWGPVWALPLSGYINVGKLLFFSEPHFLLCKVGELTAEWRSRFNKLIHADYSAQCLACRKCSNSCFPFLERDVRRKKLEVRELSQGQRDKVTGVSGVDGGGRTLVGLNISANVFSPYGGGVRSCSERKLLR